MQLAARNPGHSGQWAPFCMNLLHYLSIPCSSSMLNHYNKAMSVLLHYCCEGAILSSWYLANPPATGHWPLECAVTYFLASKHVFWLCWVGSATCSYLPSLSRHSAVTTGHLFPECAVWNYTLQNCGSVKETTGQCDFCASLSQSRFEVYPAKLG